MLSEEKSMAIERGNLLVDAPPASAALQAQSGYNIFAAPGTRRFLARLSGRRRHVRRTLGTPAAAGSGDDYKNACCNSNTDIDININSNSQSQSSNCSSSSSHNERSDSSDGCSSRRSSRQKSRENETQPPTPEHRRIIIRPPPSPPPPPPSPPPQLEPEPQPQPRLHLHHPHSHPHPHPSRDYHQYDDTIRTDASTTSSTSTETAATTTTMAPTSRGRRIPPYIATILIITYTLFGIADACSSRSTPKPRPPTPTPRPNITFHMYTCPPDYAEWYCLNGATCFTVKIAESLLYNCLCANGYIGQRCEFKDLDGSYLPSRQRVMLETASIAGGATIAVFLVVIICIAAYIHCKRKQKELRSSNVDTVDGPGRDPELRPFSNHGRSLGIFMGKNCNNTTLTPSIEQTRMPSWNYPPPETTRMASISEGKRSANQ